MKLKHPRDGARIWFFRDSDTRRTHIRDHLLTMPEAAAWVLVFPPFADVLEPLEGKERLRTWKQIASGDAATEAELAERWRDVCQSALRSATSSCWLVQIAGIETGLSTSGVLLMIDQRRQPTLLTAYLPGQGDARRTRETRREGDRQEKSIRRDSDLRRRLRPRHRDERRAAERRSGWPREKRLYYDVFRVAFQAIRAAHYDLPGEKHRAEYALLKQCLPRASQLGFEQWSEWHQQHGGA